jgi:hypothetical protein
MDRPLPSFEFSATCEELFSDPKSRIKMKSKIRKMTKSKIRSKSRIQPLPSAVPGRS